MTPKDEIEMIVVGLKEYYQPASVEDLIQALGIPLRTISHASPILCGDQACYIHTEDAETIYISDSCPEELKPFALAHELGHAMLHDDVELAHLTLHKKDASHEREADYFATKLLDVEFDAYELDGMTVDDVARILGLREDAVEYLIN